jgi:hypothetical protein
MKVHRYHHENLSLDPVLFTASETNSSHFTSVNDMVISHPVTSTLKMEAACSCETLVLPTILHGITTQKKNIVILTAVRTSNLA